MSSALFAGAIAVLLHAHGPLPTLETLIERLHAPRRGITSFEIVIDARKGEGKTNPHLERVWRDGGRYRVDFLHRFTDKGAVRSIKSTNVPQDGMYFSVWYDAVFNPSHAASMKPLSSRGGGTPGVGHDFQFEDLGATPESFVNQAHGRGIEWYFGSASEIKQFTEGAEKRVERVKWKGQTAFKMVLSGPNLPRKPLIEATLLPDRGFAVVAVRATWEWMGRSSGEDSESDLIRACGMWLPSSSVTRKYSNGKKVAELTQTIDYVRLNKSPDPKVFTLEGMDLIRGTLVGTVDGEMVWDGTKLVPHRGPERRP